MRVWLPILVILLGGSLAYWVSQTEPETETKEEAETSPIVRTITPEAQTHTIEITGNGLVTPMRDLTVHPELVGKVLWQHPQLIAGGYISKGAQLLRLNPVDYELAVEQQQAVVAQAELEREVEAARKKVAEHEWQLMGKESGRSTGLANRESHERSAAARLASARSNVELARLQLDRTRIYAPFNAMVQHESVEVGQVVFPQSLIARLVGTDAYWIIVDLPMHQLSSIALPDKAGNGGAQVSVEQSSGDSTTAFDGRVIRLLSHVEPRARMAQLIVEVPDPLGFEKEEKSLPLFLGATVRVRIQGTSYENSLEIPRLSLRDNNEVWILTADNKLDKKQVRPVHRGPNTVLIAGELEPGTVIIISDLDIPVKNMELRSESEPDVSVSQAGDDKAEP